MDSVKIEFWQVMVATLLRYFVFAGVAYLIFYRWKYKTSLPWKIQQQAPKAAAISNELTYSLITMAIFAAVIFTLLFTPMRQYTKIYTDVHQHSIAYFILSLPIVILMHDTYFYWMHRLLHWKKIFRFVHHIHHHSHNPTPLAAFSFHPIEAMLEIAILPIIVFTLPVHRLVISFFSFYMIIMNVVGHLGFEFYPKWFLKNKFSRWLNTSTHHNMHHHFGQGNYGLYFNIWDRLLKTNHPAYESEFNKVISSRLTQASEQPDIQNIAGSHESRGLLDRSPAK